MSTRSTFQAVSVRTADACARANPPDVSRVDVAQARAAHRAPPGRARDVLWCGDRVYVQIALTSRAINASLRGMDEDEPFTIPLPPPPPGMPHRDVLYFRGPGPGHGPLPDPNTPRDSEDIMLRRVPTATAMKFRVAAGGRGMTHAQYLAA